VLADEWKFQRWLWYYYYVTVKPTALASYSPWDKVTSLTRMNEILD